MNEADHEIVEFYADAKEDKFASDKEGLPVFRDVEMCRIRFPADRNRTLVVRAHAEFKKQGNKIITYAMKYPRQYERFKRDLAPVVQGTPITELPFLTEAQRKTLRAREVYTVEQLADLSRTAGQGLGMGWVAMQEKAKVFLATAKDVALSAKLAGENAELLERIKRLEAGQPVAKADSRFVSWGDDELKNYIAEVEGARPRGNPSHDTLVRMAEEASQKAAA